MRNFLLTLTILIPSLLCARTIYVSAGATGAGSSWQDAMGDLQQALAVAESGDQIWVSTGTFVPTTSDDREISFVIKDGVEIYGGFEGKESSIEERELGLYPTILSGEIGHKDSLQDNSYTIIYTEGVSAATIVDGFTITKGMSNGFGEGGDKDSSGAAWFNNAAEERVSSPTILNCIFEDNYARDGAAIYHYAEEGECTSRIENCSFINNRVDGDGAAIYNNGSYGTCSPQIRNCTFSDNSANYGAGVLNYILDEGEVSPLVESCTFVNNLSYVRGGVMYNLLEGEDDMVKCKPVIAACTMENNTSTVGNGVAEGVAVKTAEEFNKEKDAKAKNSGLVMRATTTEKK